MNKFVKVGGEVKKKAKDSVLWCFRYRTTMVMKWVPLSEIQDFEAVSVGDKTLMVDAVYAVMRGIN